MGKLLRYFIPIFCFVLLFASCEDTFNQTSQILQDLKDKQDIPNPKRIFVGGNFNFDWAGSNRWDFAVLNGQGNGDPSFFPNGGSGLMPGSFATDPGVWDIELTDDYVYVGGNFQAYDLDEDYTVTPGTDDMYQNVQRYSLSGYFDSTYNPFNGAGDQPIYALKALSDGSLVAGGHFSTAWQGKFGPFRYDSNGSAALLNFPSVPDSSGYIYSFYSLSDESILMTGGLFSQLDAASVSGNFTAVDLGDLANPAVVTSIPAPTLSNTGVRDFVQFGQYLYVAGSETAMMKPRVDRYVLSSSGITEDPSFLDNFLSDLLTGSGSISQINAIAVDGYGNVYVGGDFNWVDSLGYNHNAILKLRPDGTIDITFRVSFTYSPTPIVYDIVMQKNGKILVGGVFDNLVINDPNQTDSINANSIARITTGGKIDWDFDFMALNSGGVIYTIAVEEE